MLGYRFTDGAFVPAACAIKQALDGVVEPDKAVELCESLKAKLRGGITLSETHPSLYDGLSLMTALLFAMSATAVLNRFKPYRLRETYVFVSELEGNLIELLLQEGLENQFLVELTMENGKTYIGQPYDSGLISLGSGDVALIPFISGYRHEETKTLRLTTFYLEALNQFAYNDQSDLNLPDFRVVLPKHQIRSARRFDLEVYEKTFGPKHPDS